MDKDYLNKPFGSMNDIISLSDSVTRLTADCNYCSNDASYSHRKNMVSLDQLLIGNKDSYEALCESCYKKINCENGK